MENSITGFESIGQFFRNLFKKGTTTFPQNICYPWNYDMKLDL